MENYIWEINKSPYKSLFLEQTMTFGSKNPVFLIDQYQGKRPSLINNKFLTQGTLDVQMYPSAILDSNMIDLIDQFIQKSRSTDGYEQFLTFLIENNWDASAYFYYIEHYEKSQLDSFIKYAVPRTESLLKIQSMNELLFLKTREIVLNPEAVNHYAQQYNVTNIQEVAKKRVEEFIENYPKNAFGPMIEAIQISLMKMVLIKKVELPKSTPIEQYEEMKRFLKEDLNKMMARELHLSLHYFCNKAGKLLGIEASTPIEKAMKIIKSTSWDIFLLRMPELLFNESPSEVCISYVVTQEKKLQELARLFTLERLVSVQGIRLPVVSYSLKLIPESILEQLPHEDFDGSRSESNAVPAGLYEAMKKEIERFCK